MCCYLHQLQNEPVATARAGCDAAVVVHLRNVAVAVFSITLS